MWLTLVLVLGRSPTISLGCPEEDQMEAFVLIVAEVLSELLGRVARLTNPRIQVFHSIATGLMEVAPILDSKEAKAFLTLLI